MASAVVLRLLVVCILPVVPYRTVWEATDQKFCSFPFAPLPLPLPLPLPSPCIYLCDCIYVLSPSVTTTVQHSPAAAAISTHGMYYCAIPYRTVPYRAVLCRPVLHLLLGEFVAFLIETPLVEFFQDDPQPLSRRRNRQQEGPELLDFDLVNFGGRTGGSDAGVVATDRKNGFQ